MIGIILYSFITFNQIRINVINYGMANISVSLEHMKQHCPTANKRFDISQVILFVKISGEQYFKLPYKLAFSTHPLDKRFCFCHNE